jgi:2-keto-3-deoxy-L-rhamnonate aldolase RhmA
MLTNTVKKALAEGKVQFGTGFGQLRSPEVPRILAAAGFHWAFIDTEHGGFDLETVQDLCRVSNLVGFCPIVRVGDMQYSLVARALDCGAQGIIFPRVESPELLEKAISWMKFPPMGMRGYGLGPTQTEFEPLSFSQIIEHMNANTMAVFQIETKRALDAREELLSVPGVDAVMVGPADLSISLGVPGEFQHPKMVAAMDAIRDSCDRHGVAPGTQTRSPELAKFWRDRGMRFLGCSSETSMILDRAKELISLMSVTAAAPR